MSEEFEVATIDSDAQFDQDLRELKVLAARLYDAVLGSTLEVPALGAALGFGATDWGQLR